uniref:Diacylglycerol kinase n=1 Tax=Macrostomum lignano TaxID=282301 RepID=A0A1I8FL28_9PLAT
ACSAAGARSACTTSARAVDQRVRPRRPPRARAAPTAIFPAVLDRGRPAAAANESLPNSQSAGSQLDQLACSPHQQSSSFQIVPPSGCVPLLVFINPKSGGKQGVRILHKMQYLLNPRQVTAGLPHPGVRRRRHGGLAAGGHGQVRLGDNRPPVAVLPLGTGNDLARCLRWAAATRTRAWRKFCTASARGSNNGDAAEAGDAGSGAGRPREDPAGAAAVEPARDEIPATIINNYFSIGVDAAIAHRWHLLREKHRKNSSRDFETRPTMWRWAATEMLGGSCKNLHESLDIICDGYALDLGSGTPLEGMALLNINSVYGGRTLWRTTESEARRPAAAAARLQRRRRRAAGRQAEAERRSQREQRRELSSASLSNNELAFAVQDMGDQLIEVVGLENAVHAGMVAGGLRSSGKRLAQCSEVVIRTRRRFPMQIDGEPWSQAPCTISITHMNQVPMIMAPPPAKKGGLLGLFSKSSPPRPAASGGTEPGIRRRGQQLSAPAALSQVFIYYFHSAFRS